MAFIYFFALIVLRSIPALSSPPEIGSSSYNPSSDDEIDHTQFLVNDISNLYLDEKFSDVVFVVNYEHLPAHRPMLALNSEYFSKCFYGGFEEARQPNMKIDVVTSSPTAFQILLKYNYTGQVNLNGLEEEVIVELFRISNYYGFYNLQLSLSEYFQSNITIDNACSLFAEARLYGDEKLYADSLDFMESSEYDTKSVLESEDFLDLPAGALQEILNRDTFVAKELDIFKVVCDWIRKQQDLDTDTKTKVLSAVRYPLISDQDLITVVAESQMISSETISDVINLKETTPHDELERRERLPDSQQKPDVNFVQTSRLNVDINTTDAIIIINLGHPKMINYIKFNFPHLHHWNSRHEEEWYSYYIEVSTNQSQWVRVLDYSGYICRSIQRLWINPQTVQYIKIVATRNAHGRKFEILEIKYNTKERHLVDIENGLVAPKYNVALISKNATVIQERSFSNNSMLTGDLRKFDKSYSCHQLESGCIVVQLAQPYVLSSLRMLLWDENDANLGYTVEVSVDNVIWEKIADESNARIKSWQHLHFESRPMVFIRITGVSNSKSENFCVALLEAPAAQVYLPSYMKNID